MSFFRVTTGGAPVPIPDLGIELPASSTVVLSNQFSVNDLYLSADLEALIIAATITVEIDYGTGWSSIAAADYTNRDCLAAFMNVYEITNENNNEKLVDGSEVNNAKTGGGALHVHDGRYFTESELGATTGAGLIGADDTAWDPSMTFTTVQGFIDGMFTYLAGFDLDDVYDNDADGILNVDGVSKDLDFRSDNVNAIKISRFSTPDLQTVLNFIPGANPMLELGALVVGSLGQVDVKVLSNLYVDGNITFTGTITDQTVNNMNVTNQKITLRDGAATGANAFVMVERGSSGADASLKWNESTLRWQAGLDGSEQTIALLEANELVTGVWEFQGAATTDPSMYMTNKSAAPTTQLGSASQIPIAIINNMPAIYDKTRSKWIGYSRQYITFTGRDNANNQNEYARIGLFTSNESSVRLSRASVLVGMTINTNGAETWTARVRKNGSVTNLASLAASAVNGAKTTVLSVDFAADDIVQVFIESASGIDRPVIELEFAPLF